MSAIYVLSNPKESNKYKVGIHSGGLIDLEKRYKTYIPNVVVHWFIMTKNAKDVEKLFKDLHESYREPNLTARSSEWFIMPLDQIIKSILLLISLNLEVEKSINGTIIVDLAEISDDETDSVESSETDAEDSELKETSFPILYIKQVLALEHTISSEVSFHKDAEGLTCIPTSIIYNDYKEWSLTNNFKVLAQTIFSNIISNVIGKTVTVRKNRCFKVKEDILVDVVENADSKPKLNKKMRRVIDPIQITKTMMDSLKEPIEKLEDWYIVNSGIGMRKNFIKSQFSKTRIQEVCDIICENFVQSKQLISRTEFNKIINGIIRQKTKLVKGVRSGELVCAIVFLDLDIVIDEDDEDNIIQIFIEQSH
jgi:hypothetical protein